MKLISNWKQNLADSYTLVVLVVGVPASVALLTNYKVGLLLSFIIQGVIGVLYVKGSR